MQPKYLTSLAAVIGGLLLFSSALLPFNSVAAEPPIGTVVSQQSTLTITPPAGDLGDIHPMALPDLVVESITFSPANPDVGASVDITVTVKNQGTSAASGFYVYLYVDPADKPPTSTTSYTARTYYGLSLNSGASFKWVRTGQTFAAAGNHPLYAWVDRDNAIAESDETNNLAGPVNIPIGSFESLVYLPIITR